MQILIRAKSLNIIFLMKNKIYYPLPSKARVMNTSTSTCQEATCGANNNSILQRKRSSLGASNAIPSVLSPLPAGTSCKVINSCYISNTEARRSFETLRNYVLKLKKIIMGTRLLQETV